MAQYQGIPAIPSEQIPQWQYDLFAAMKENLEIMMGARGPGRVVSNDSVFVEPQERQRMKQITARGDFYAITTGSGTFNMPAIEDYIKLLNDVQQLAVDVANIQNALNALLRNLKA
jgi:hypothetical protein